MEKKEKVKSIRYVDGEAVDAVDDEVPSQTFTALDTMTYPRITLASNMPTMKDPYMCSVFQHSRCHSSPRTLSSQHQDDDREDFLYTSPLGTYDVTKRFLEVITAVGAREPQLVEGLRNGLGAEDNQRLALLIAKVTERQQQLQQQTTIP